MINIKKIWLWGYFNLCIVFKFCFLMLYVYYNMQIIVQNKENTQISDINNNKEWTNHENGTDSAGLG
jgi:hypothetical protein